MSKQAAHTPVDFREFALPLSYVLEVFLHPDGGTIVRYIDPAIASGVSSKRTKMAYADAIGRWKTAASYT